MFNGFHWLEPRCSIGSIGFIGWIGSKEDSLKGNLKIVNRNGQKYGHYLSSVKRLKIETMDIQCD